MKIFFNSSFSCGKTKLKLASAKKFNLIPIPEMFRVLLAEKEISIQQARSDLSLIEELQKEVLIRQHQAEKQAYELAKLEGKNGITACRSLDSYSFMIKFCSQDFVYSITKEKFFLDYIEWLKEDSFHFLVKPEKSLLVNDGIRDTDWSLSLEIYGIVKSLLKIYGIKYVLISDVELSDRLETIERTVR